MPRNITAQQLRYQFSLVSNTLDFYGFVEELLDTVPREDDFWQMEKWENFKQSCIGILRMPEAVLQRILDYNVEEQ